MAPAKPQGWVHAALGVGGTRPFLTAADAPSRKLSVGVVEPCGEYEYEYDYDNDYDCMTRAVRQRIPPWMN
jgi:hypothetical protein